MLAMDLTSGGSIREVPQGPVVRVLALSGPLAWPTGEGLRHICISLGRIRSLSCVFLGDAFIGSVSQDVIRVTSSSLFPSPSSRPPLLPMLFQVWFQNRRAKFRRNERAMLANKNASLLKSYSGDVTAVEQPIVPRPAPRPTDYLSWGTASPYR